MHTVTKTALALICLVFATDTGAINCARATNPSETAICDSTSLKGADDNLQIVYDKLSSSLGQVSPSSRRDLVQSQRKWIAARNEMCGANISCLLREITSRTNSLSLALVPAVPDNKPTAKPNVTPSPTEVESLPSGDMTFLVIESPCYRHCPSTIFAQGVFAKNTAEKFAAFIRRYPAKVLAFDSNGGDLQSALRMGKMIREHQIDTVVHGYDFQSCTYGLRGETCVTLKRGPSGCYSACSYAFMGGRVRTVENRAKFGVHQLRGSRADIGESDAQAMTAVLGRYLDEVGIDRRLLDFASLTRAENMRILSNKELVALRVDNSALDFGNWALKTDLQGEPFAQYVSKGANEVTWTIQIRRVQVGLLMLVAKSDPRSRYALTDEPGIRETLDLIHWRLVEDERGDAWSIEVSNASGKVSLPSKNKWRWIAREKTVISEIVIPLTAVPTLSSAKWVTLEADFPESIRDLDVSVAIGVSGLSDAVKILARIAPP